jgi:RND family efflux transporter MFP subunit
MVRTVKIITPFIILLAMGGAAWQLMANSPKAKHQSVAPQPPLVSTMQVFPQDVHIPILTQGTVKPRTQISLAAEVSGRIVETAPQFADGAFFKQGDVLLRINDRDYRLAVTKTEALVATARQQLAQSEAEYKQKLEEYRNVDRSKVTDFALRKPQYEEALARLKAAKADLELAQLQLSRCEIRAPFDGRIVARQADVGQYVTPGKMVAEIYAVDAVQIHLPLSQTQAELLELPMNLEGKPSGVAVQLSGQYAGQKHTWEGEIVRTQASIDERNRMLYVIAQVTDPYGMHATNHSQPPLAIGSFTEAKIQSRLIPNVYVLPRPAVHNMSKVWLMNDANQLQLQSVEVIHRGDNNVYISGGLNPGDTVITSPLDVVVDGMQLRIASENETLEQTP